MKKAIKYGINGALIGGIGNGLINAIKQNSVIEPFNWTSLFKAIFKGAFVVGGGGYLTGLGVDYLNSLEKPLNTDAVLFTFLNEIRLEKDDNDYQSLNHKCD